MRCIRFMLATNQPALLWVLISWELETIASVVSTSSSFRSFGCIVRRDLLRPEADVITWVAPLTHPQNAVQALW